MRVLVANRGEIAARLLQALNELDIESVAIHTPTDRLHIEAATHAVQIPSATTFMKIDEMIRIAKESKCTAILPGYGFLSESAEFAQKCSEQGFMFVGPSADVLRFLGDKSSAKEIASVVGVPVLPSQKIETLRDVENFAKLVQYPIMLKAQDGGGGKGIRIVRSREEIEPLMQEALNESHARQLFAEKAALEGFKHVEIQILADSHGNVETIFERECSLQRKFQKVVEIAPSSLPRARIRPLEEAAVKLAKHVHYLGLGTFEFLVNARGTDYYFMECNPRIQVEHTITEQISGLDLGHLLLQVTLQGLNLQGVAFPREPRGTSIQLRINAEDPKTFAASRGTITSAAFPSGPGIRVDSVLTKLRPGLTYPSTDEYDSLVAKLIVTSTTYRLALKKAIGALHSLHLEGITTNKDLLCGLLHSDLMNHPETADVRSLSAANVLETIVQTGSDICIQMSNMTETRLTAVQVSPSKSSALSAMPATALLKKGDTFKLMLGDGKAASKLRQIKIERILKNNFPEHISADVTVDGNKRTLQLEKALGSSSHKKAEPLNNSHIGLPFAGILVELLVDPGDQIEEAETVAIFRQGKMELDVRAPFRGTISEVADIKEGEAVGIGALIAVISATTSVAKL